MEKANPAHTRIHSKIGFTSVWCPRFSDRKRAGKVHGDTLSTSLWAAGEWNVHRYLSSRFHAAPHQIYIATSTSFTLLPRPNA